MIQTFRQERRLTTASRVNKFWYMMRKIPLIGRKIPVDVYEADGFKKFARVYGVVSEVFARLFGVAFYLLTMVGGPAMLIGLTIRGGGAADAARCAQWVFLFLTIAGGLINTDVFMPSEEKYYALILMRIDAKESALSTLVFMLVSRGLPMALALTGLSLAFPAYFPALSAAGAIVFWLGVKVNGSAASLKLTLMPEEDKWGERARTACVILALAGMLVLPFAGVPVPAWLWPALGAASAAGAVFSLRYMRRCGDYREAYRRILRREACFPDVNAAVELNAKNLEKSIGETAEERGSFHGVSGLHRLFVTRHRKILWKRSLILTGIFAAAAAVALVWMAVKRPAGLNLTRFILPLPFVMYLINQGQNVAQTMFVNCDEALLRYGFFRKRSVILSLFWHRLWSVTAMNLVPAAVMAVFLAAAQFLLQPGTPAAAAVPAALCPLSLSLFFSVHRLGMYYLLQPFTDTKQIRSPMYKAVDMITYMVSLFFLYSGKEIEASAQTLGIWFTAFSLIYIALILGLVWWRAPKTFRIRI